MIADVHFSFFARKLTLPPHLFTILFVQHCHPNNLFSLRLTLISFGGVLLTQCMQILASHVVGLCYFRYYHNSLLIELDGLDCRLTYQQLPDARVSLKVDVPCVLVARREQRIQFGAAVCRWRH